MIVIRDLSQEALDDLKYELGEVCYVVADMGAPKTYKVTLKDQATILYKGGGKYVLIEYMDRQFHLYLSDFATMEIL